MGLGVVLSLVTSHAAPDARRYRFHLRSGVRIYKGKELSSEDVVWTFQSILDGTVISPKKSALTQIERVEAVDALTVDFVMAEPLGAIYAYLRLNLEDPVL
jgi:peptide/nickel transport system substrate-binding protein